jgi:putative chitinase
MSATIREFTQAHPANLGSPAAAAAVLLLRSMPVSLAATLDQVLQTIAPHLPPTEHAAWIEAMGPPMQQAAIITGVRIAAFLGQCAFESDGFRQLEENLSYSAERLCQVWPHRFPSSSAAEACARQPERLANEVYAGRMGNGDAASGDGWRFRGRGLIQITGRTAYESFAKAIDMPLDAVTDYCATRPGAVSSAGWFWTSRRLNSLADAWALEKLTFLINGSTQAAAERARLCVAARHIMGV